MNIKEIEVVSNLPASKRYEYFIKKVTDFEEVWGLYYDGWAILEDDNGNTLMPFWPKKEFANLCAVDEWNDYKAEQIELEDFMQVSWYEDRWHQTFNILEQCRLCIVRY
ncbi:DUF2750 domain-containing protein [Rossellomorea aquimaris]|uniref:DUF2750 domain-containing protein n=1 Tax=Rossellomorea aquimaris TaxID=189382 RepID=UPI000AF45252|nr:DUF2750 domain-containing protein [Rossellomorea aquimaris]